MPKSNASDDVDNPWRKRYYEELDQLERDLETSRGAEDALRRLCSRLCLAAQGQSVSLDRSLDETQGALRSKAGVGSIEPLITELTLAIERLDAGPQPLAEQAPDHSEQIENRGILAGGILVQIIDQLDLDGETRDKAGVLRARLCGANCGDGLNAAIAELADILKGQNRQINERVRHFRALLQRVTQRLDDVTQHLVQDEESRDQGSQNSQALNERIQNEMQALNRVSREANDLTSLQRDVEDKISRVDSHLLSYRERERELASNYKARGDQMKLRISELENHAKTLEVAMEKQRKKALTDSLTGIANREAYLQAAAGFFKNCRDAPKPLSLAIWDIDEFKAINDTFGHQAGDKALQLVAQHLNRSMGEQAMTARVGGEEFATFLPGRTANMAVNILDRVRQEVQNLPFRHADKPVAITVSCGVTEITPDDSLDTAYSRADTAMYAAKRGGRNQVRVI
ncbi:MAG: diguanylate cyclase [Oceanococcus sp.]